MKIKTKQRLNLPELIQHVWENEVYPNRYVNNIHGEIVFNDAGKFMTDDSFISPNSYFTVEVEEIVTPTTRFDELTEYIYDSNDDHHFTAEHKGADISMIIDCETHQFKTQAIYCKDTLIWTKEHGIPESGVLEVDVE